MLLAVSASALAQQPTFRGGTTLVELSVVATDDSGAPVTNLTKDDLVVLDRGAPRDIAFFRFEGAPENSKAAELPAGLFTNRPEYAAPSARNVTAIVIDSVNSPLWDQGQAREQLLRYLETMPAGSRVALYQLGWRTRVLHDFTSDLDSLRARVREIVADAAAHAVVASDQLATSAGMSPEAREIMSVAAEDMKRQEEAYSETVDDRKRAVTLAGLEAIGAHLAAVPGRKSLVWLTMGMPILTSYQGFLRNHEPQLRRAAELLASEGVAIYPVDILGLRGPNLGMSVRPSLGGVMGSAGAVVNQRLWSTMIVMADITGGRFSRNTNDMAAGLKVATDDLRGSYTLGFYAAADPDGGWRKVDVKARRRGLHLTYKQGYLLDAPAPTPVSWSEERWRSSIQSPLISSVVRLDARLDTPPGTAPGTRDLVLQITSDDLLFHPSGGRLVADVEIGIAEKAPSGAFAYRKEAVTFVLPESVATSDLVMPYRTRWTLRADTAVVRVIVRDRSAGRYGALDINAR